MTVEIHGDRLVWWPVCPNPSCQFVMTRKEIDLNAVLNPGNQCPRCLCHLDMNEVAVALQPQEARA